MATEFKERQNQLVSERDAAVSQNEATAKELESAKAELQSLGKQNRDVAGKPSTETDSAALNAEIAQLNAQKAALLTENASLKEQLASLQANPGAPGNTSNAELEQSIQATKDAQKRLAVRKAKLISTCLGVLMIVCRTSKRDQGQWYRRLASCGRRL